MSEESERRVEPNPCLERRWRRLEKAGARRVEVSVPAADAGLVRAIARTLLEDGEGAQALRSQFVPLVDVSPARTGTELLAFFRSSPLVGAGLEFERDRFADRPIELS